MAAAARCACSGLRVAPRGLALAMAGTLFRSSGVSVIRSQRRGLSGPQVDAAGDPKGQGDSCSLDCVRFCSERRAPSGEQASVLWRPLLASSSKPFILASLEVTAPLPPPLVVRFHFRLFLLGLAPLF